MVSRQAAELGSDGAGRLVDCDEFREKHEYLRCYFDEETPYDFYRYLFPEGSFERRGHQEDCKPNGLVLYRDAGKRSHRHLLLTDGLEQLDGALGHDFSICAPIGWCGMRGKTRNSRLLFALTLDIDYVGLRELQNLLYWFENDIAPRPTYVVNSGHGVHLYYVFEEPVRMYPQNRRELTRLKKALVKHIWTQHTSTRPEAMEALGLTQKFRMVGSPTKLPGCLLTAHMTGERVTPEYLNGFVPEECRANLSGVGRLTIAEARERYPEWYERIVVRGEAPGTWTVKRDLYDWFLKKVESEATFGHRYFCVMVLGIYAQKCGVPYEELEADALRLQPVLSRIRPDKPFTEEEALKAIEVYDGDYHRFPRESVERVTGMAMPANKRNGRKQEQHLRIARFARDLNYEDGDGWQNKEGRPKGSPNKEHPKRDAVLAYFEAHPGSSHSEAARALGISRTTVIKWTKAENRAGST